MNNQHLLIRLHLTGVIVYTQSTDGRLINELGRFYSVETAAVAFRSTNPQIFLEDCLFDLNDSVRRYRLTWKSRSERTDEIELTPANTSARRGRSYSHEEANSRFYKTTDNGCVFISENARFQPLPVNPRCTRPGNHPHSGNGESVELAIKPDMSDPAEL